MTVTPTPTWTKPPETRTEFKETFFIEGYRGNLFIGFYEDGRPCEVRIVMEATGTTVGRLFDQIAKLLSSLFQYGVPLEGIAERFDTWLQGDQTICPSVPGPDRIVKQLLELIMSATRRRKKDILDDCP